MLTSVTDLLGIKVRRLSFPSLSFLGLLLQRSFFLGALAFSLLGVASLLLVGIGLAPLPFGGVGFPLPSRGIICSVALLFQLSGVGFPLPSRGLLTVALLLFPLSGVDIALPLLLRLALSAFVEKVSYASVEPF